MRRRRAAVLGCLVVLASVLAGCRHARDTRSAPPGPVTMTVSARQALLDVPVSVALHGLPAGARTTVTATAPTSRRDLDLVGAVPGGCCRCGLAGRASLAGSYTGSNPMGLFEFMRRRASPSRTTSSSRHRI